MRRELASPQFVVQFAPWPEEEEKGPGFSCSHNYVLRIPRPPYTTVQL